jgi:hypothetical protein
MKASLVQEEGFSTDGIECLLSEYHHILVYIFPEREHREKNMGVGRLFGKRSLNTKVRNLRLRRKEKQVKMRREKREE